MAGPSACSAPAPAPGRRPPVAVIVILADGRRIAPRRRGCLATTEPDVSQWFLGDRSARCGGRRATSSWRPRRGSSDGTLARAPIGSIEVVEPPARVELHVTGKRTAPLIAICMATYNSDPSSFAPRSIRSARRRMTDWVCLISDDCSEPERFERYRRRSRDDPFHRPRSSERLGFYRNFERLLAMAPAEAELHRALSDHDDRWYPDKLAALREAIGDAELAFSDAPAVDAAGNVRAESLSRTAAQELREPRVAADLEYGRRAPLASSAGTRSSGRFPSRKAPGGTFTTTGSRSSPSPWARSPTSTGLSMTTCSTPAPCLGRLSAPRSDAGGPRACARRRGATSWRAGAPPISACTSSATFWPGSSLRDAMPS